MTTNTFEEQLKQLMQSWNERLEEFKKQFSGEGANASEAFEKQKEHFKSMVIALRDHLAKATDIAEENMRSMKGKLEELYLQLNLGKAEGADAFEEQKKKIEAALHEVYVEGKKIFGKSFEHMLQLFDTNAEAFRAGLEVVKLQFAMSTAKDEQEKSRLKSEINGKVDEMQESFKQAQELGKQNLEEWNKAINEGFNKLKDYFEGLQKKK